MIRITNEKELIRTIKNEINTRKSEISDFYIHWTVHLDYENLVSTSKIDDIEMYIKTEEEEEQISIISQDYMKTLIKNRSVYYYDSYADECIIVVYKLSLYKLLASMSIE